ncbi:sigma factor-like helix-turn-helix DNA-binding protein [Nocardioides dilutus]
MNRADQDSFESFYKDVRSGLLVQTYALTGDLQASQKAVRDAMVVAWHHWRKVSRLEDREDYVRPLAWSRALRRSQARWWSRMKGLDAEVAATLDALAKLPVTQRRVLLLSHLTSLPLEGISREVGISRANTERELQNATAQFAVNREVESTGIRPVLEVLRTQIDEVRWPRPSIITRAGSARRRSHTTFGAAVAVAALVVSGSVVTDAAGVRPSLDTKGLLEGVQPEPPETTPRPDPDVPPLTPEALLTADLVGGALTGTWTQGKTSGNTEGDGLVFACQGGRYADPAGLAALVRTFKPEAADDPSTAGQSVEVSADEEAGRTTYRTTAGWYAGCMAPRMQLLSTHRVKGVGDQAMLFVLRDWNEPTKAQVVGVARSGAVTTTTSLTRTGTRDPDAEPSATLLASAVDGLCGLPAGGTCADTPRLKAVPPMATGSSPALLSEVDLPPVTKVTQPWVGTPPEEATTNLAATRCDESDFSADGFSRGETRSFLVPGADLPPEFGLTQTVGALPRKDAEAFIAGVRKKLTSCPDRDLATQVDEVKTTSEGDRELTVWRLTVEVSDERSVTYLMGILRNGTAVSQLTFVPADGVVMGGEPFIALAVRAQDRLARLGRPKG